MAEQMVTDRDYIIAAACRRLARDAELIALLPDLDLALAQRALALFELPGDTVAWLLSEEIAPLNYHPPVELAQTEEGKVWVLQVLNEIEHQVIQPS